MQMAPQEVRTFFVSAVTWGRRPIFRAAPMARLFLDTLRNYLWQNPVKRHLVENAQEYPYSSASGSLEVDPAPPGLKAQTMRAISSSVPLGGTDASTVVYANLSCAYRCPAAK
jgi:hypothetical protein